MSTKAEAFRRKAVECENHAATALGEEAKQSWLELAADWRALASQIERNGLDKKID